MKEALPVVLVVVPDRCHHQSSGCGRSAICGAPTNTHWPRPPKPDASCHQASSYPVIRARIRRQLVMISSERCLGKTQSGCALLIRLLPAYSFATTKGGPHPSSDSTCFFPSYTTLAPTANGQLSLPCPSNLVRLSLPQASKKQKQNPLQDEGLLRPRCRGPCRWYQRRAQRNRRYHHHPRHQVHHVLPCMLIIHRRQSFRTRNAISKLTCKQYPTTITVGKKTYTVTEATTLTITGMFSLSTPRLL